MLDKMGESSCGCICPDGEREDCRKGYERDSLIEKDPWFNLDITYTFEGAVDTPAGWVPRIKTRLSRRDILQDWKARWSLKRDLFKIPAGLYAVGHPGPDSPVLVSANYKLTFDKLRKELEGMDVWLLILNTWGINVWCSAGKGTFGAQEVIHRIKVTHLDRVVRHRKLILPQLAAPGVRSSEVKRHSGFQVIYGPVRACDIGEFVKNGNKASREMRRVHFSLLDRIVLTPMEIMISIRALPLVFLMLLLINWIHHGQEGLMQLVQIALKNTIPYLGAIVMGAFVVPILLPILPFRAFSLKGCLAGLLWSGAVISLKNSFFISAYWTALLGHTLLLTAMISFLSLNFTGSTTFTSFSGAQRETALSIPIIIAASLMGIILLIFSRFVG